ncbi:MAG: hypothetical protein AAFQ68_21055, partial [Bacteroidota bacterium]
MKTILALGLLLGFLSNASATHFAGGEITYEHLNGNSYRVTMKLFRDCDGINFGSSQTIRLSPSTSGSSFRVFEQSRSDITVLCPGQVAPCNNGGFGGIQEIIYSGIQTFNTLPAGQVYTMSYSTCCRNNDITTLFSPGSNSWYISSTLDPNLSIRNTSPVFLNPPYTFLVVCAGQSVSISPNAFDADGDALQYSLTNCLQGATQTVTYRSGFSGASPLATASGVNVDPFTGLVTFTPTQAQVGVVCILVEEFRNGVKIGEIVRDIQVNIAACTNAPPVVAPITNKIVAPGTTLCLNVSATDADNNNITLSAFSGLFPANATFTQTSSVPGSATGQICISPTSAQVGQTFSVTIEARDDDCPAVAIGSETFTVTVPAVTCATSLNNSITNATDCNTADGAIDITPNGFFNPIQYTWTGPNGFTANTQDISGLEAGDYTINVVGGASCVETATYTVGLNTPLPTTGLIENATMMVGAPNMPITFSSPPTGTAPFTYDFTLTGNNLGALIMGGTAMTAQVTGVDPANPATFPTLTVMNLDPTFLGAGVDGFTFYEYTVTDANGCVATGMPMFRIDVVFPAVTNLTLNSVTLTECESVPGSGMADFDLESAQDLANGDVDNDGADGSVYTVTYHPSQMDAQNGTNALANGNGLNPMTDEVWVKVVSASGAEGVIQLGLVVQENFDRLCVANNWGDDVPTSYISNIATYNHAVYLYDFPDGSGGLLDPRFLWETTGSFKFLNDGTGTLTGTVVNAQDPNVKFEVEFLIENRRDWLAWSALGRTYKDDSPHNTKAATEFMNWSYFEINPGSNLTGTAGSTYDGDMLTLTHMPANFMMGGQMGIGANDKDDSYG